MVWTTDITYLKVEGRTYYLCVVLDWASREVLGYSIGRNMTVELCHDALTMALSGGRKPEILNTDQGSQYTSESWLSRVRLLGITPSMDGKGSWRDNVRMERFWRTYKYELFSLYDDVTLKAIEERLKTWIRYYNSERVHSALGNKTPEEWRKEHQSAACPPIRRNFLAIFPLRRGVALRATRPRLRSKIAKKLGLTINAKSSNLTTAPSIGSEIP